MFKKLINFLFPSLISATLAVITPAQALTTWGPNNAPPFNVINITSGSTYTVQSLNALETNILWNSNSGSAKALTLKGCTSADKGNKVLVWDQYGDAGTNNITITPVSGTINSTSSIAIAGNYNVVSLVCDGISNWNSNTTIGGATNTDVRNNTLYVPASCDGVAGEDGVINSSTTFVSASAGFTSADVGKKISINGAGDKQYFKTATIAANGANYVVGEEITLSGGTGTAATVIVRTVNGGGGVLTVSGKAGSLGSYSLVPGNAVSQSSTTGIGTGATFNVTWNRTNLVTTIDSVTNSTTVVLSATANATGTGAMWGYGTDYSSRINTEIARGYKVRLPTGRCGVGTTISINSLQELEGQGVAGYNTAPSELLWLGAEDGTVLNFDNGTLVNGGRVGPLNIHGLGAAKYGARFRGMAHGRADISVRAIKDFATSFEESQDGLYDTFFNDFRIVAAENHASASSGICLYFPKATISSGAHDVNGNNFYTTSCLHQNGVGIDLQEGYLNNFYLTQLYGTGSTFGIRFGGSTVDTRQTARNNVFYNLISQADILSEGGVTYPAVQNRIDPLDKVAYATKANIGTNSILWIHTSDGNDNFGTQIGYDVRSCGNPTGTVTSANYVAMGCAGSVTLRTTGRVKITIDGTLTNNTPASGILATLYYGTGSAPANGDNIETAGTTRTQCGGFPALADTPSANFVVPFTITCQAALAAAGSTFWYDVGIKVVGAGTASISNVKLTALEMK